jgi:PST family polysaccharide transporter
VPDAVLRRDLAFRKRAGVEISRAVARGAVSVPLAVLGFGPWALVVGILASEAVGVVLTWWATRFLPTFRLDRTVARTLLGFGSAVLTLKVLGAVLENADYYIVGSQLGTYELGVYTLAYRIPELVLANVFWIFSSVAFSVYSRARSEDAGLLRSVATRALQLITLFAFPTGIGMAVVSLPLTMSFLGDQWEGAAAPMMFVALAMAASSIGYASGDVFPAVGRPGLLIKIVAPMVVVKTTGLLLAAPHGLTAMAATLAGLSVAFSTVRLIVANRLLGVRMRTSLHAMTPGVVAAIGAAAGALPVVLSREPDVVTLVLAVAAGIVGAAALLLLCCRPTLRELVPLVASMRRPAA